SRALRFSLLFTSCTSHQIIKLALTYL
ncbi:HAD family hydrolase, partial [Escherichia coli]